MFFRRLYLFAVVAAVSILGTNPASGQAPASAPAEPQAAQGQAPSAGQPTAPKKEWKDRGEYDLYEAANKALTAKPPDFNKALTALDQWNTKYVKTDYGLERQQLYYTAYEGLGQLDKAIQAGTEALAVDPKDIRTLYGMTSLVPKLKNPTPEMLSACEKAAQTLVSNLDSLKPANVTPEDWKKAEADFQVSAYTSLGLIAQQRKDYEAAEKNFKEALKIKPENGPVAYSLATVILAQKKPETQAEALFYFARATAYDGPGALAPAGRKDLQSYLTKAYTTFHGSAEGLPQLLTLAKANPTPPADFKILTGPEVAAIKDKQLQQDNPQLALWLKIKELLSGADGDQQFEQNVKGTAVPELSGSLISQKPEKGPAKELVLGISGDQKTPEVTLKLIEGGTLPGAGEAGSKITFAEGVPVAFAKEPFMVTLEVDKTKVKGWTGKAAAPARKTTPTKKGTTKKK